MFVSELSFITAHWKVMASVTTMIGLIIAEANVPPSTAEDYTLKGLLVLTVGYLARLLLKQQDDHKKEREVEAEKHLQSAHDRELKMLDAMNAQTSQLKELTALAREQTDYHKAVTRTLIEERLAKPKLP